MKKIIFGIVIFFMVVFFMIRSNFSDVIINKYPTIDEVKTDKAIDKGWVPSLLPSSAYNIMETHDLEKHSLFGKFYYKKADEEILFSKLKLRNDSNDTYEWKNFLFKVDKEKKIVKYRNKPMLKRN